MDGRFFGTSDGAGGGNPRGGAGWLDDGAPDASSHVYRAYHLLASVLKSSSTAGHIVSIQLTNLMGTTAVEVDDVVQVAYQENQDGSLLATAIAYPGSAVATGAVTAIASDGSSLTLQTSSGASLTFAVINPQLLEAVVVGDTADVTYTTDGAVQTARAVSVTATDSAAATPSSGAGG